MASETVVLCYEIHRINICYVKSISRGLFPLPLCDVMLATCYEEVIERRHRGEVKSRNCLKAAYRL